MHRSSRPSRLRLAFALAMFLQVVAPSSLWSQSSATRADTIARGRAIFVATCRTCHTVTPPPQAAPPISVIAQRYLAGSDARGAAARIADWLAMPSVEKSLLPKAEVARFGVMPHQPLADAGRFSVAAYVLTLADSAPGGGRRRRR